MKAKDKLKELVNAGWQVHLFLGECNGEIDVEDFGATAGDCNCPIQKEYDPKDGHGWSQVDLEIEDISDDDGLSFDNGIELIYQKCKRKEKNFGLMRDEE